MSNENHNHITREIKAPGECYSCDRYHAKHSESAIRELRNLIYSVLLTAENGSADLAIRNLTHEAQILGIYRIENE
jgi:hypothetical protein